MAFFFLHDIDFKSKILYTTQFHKFSEFFFYYAVSESLSSYIFISIIRIHFDVPCIFHESRSLNLNFRTFFMFRFFFFTILYSKVINRIIERMGVKQKK